MSAAIESPPWSDDPEQAARQYQDLVRNADEHSSFRFGKPVPLAARKARGLPLGTPRDMSAYQRRASRLGNETNRAKAEARARLIAPAIEAARAGGNASLRQIAAYLNAESIPTPRGKLWTATEVRNALEQLKAA